jgi:hypothetical protein
VGTSLKQAEVIKAAKQDSQLAVEGSGFPPSLFRAIWQCVIRTA